MYKYIFRDNESAASTRLADEPPCTETHEKPTEASGFSRDMESLPFTPQRFVKTLSIHIFKHLTYCLLYL